MFHVTMDASLIICTISATDMDELASDDDSDYTMGELTSQSDSETDDEYQQQTNKVNDLQGM